MKTLVLGSLLLLAIPSFGFADGDGVEVLPFNSPGGQVSGQVIVSADGSAQVIGVVQGVPFSSAPWLKVWRGADNTFDFTWLLCDGDLLIRYHTYIPLKLKFWGTKEDASDGDQTDDMVGEIDVKSQMGVGKGSVQLGG